MYVYCHSHLCLKHARRTPHPAALAMDEAAFRRYREQQLREMREGIWQPAPEPKKAPPVLPPPGLPLPPQGSCDGTTAAATASAQPLYKPPPPPPSPTWQPEQQPMPVSPRIVANLAQLAAYTPPLSPTPSSWVVVKSPPTSPPRRLEEMQRLNAVEQQRRNEAVFKPPPPEARTSAWEFEREVRRRQPKPPQVEYKPPPADGVPLPARLQQFERECFERTLGKARVSNPPTKNPPPCDFPKSFPNPQLWRPPPPQPREGWPLPQPREPPFKYPPAWIQQPPTFKPPPRQDAPGWLATPVRQCAVTAFNPREYLRMQALGPPPPPTPLKAPPLAPPPPPAGTLGTDENGMDAPLGLSASSGTWSSWPPPSSP